MDYGTVLGHGAYLGPDYTAEALHLTTEAMRRERAVGFADLGVGPKAAIDAEIAHELKTDRYASGTLRFTAGQAAGWNAIVEHYRKLFVEGQLARALPKGALLPASEGGGNPVRELERPGSWPPSSPGRRGFPWPSARRLRTPTPITGPTTSPRAIPRPPVP